MKTCEFNIDKNKCTGCSACVNICPKGAISIELDSYGFGYPNVDKDKCIGCNLCKKVCDYQNDNVDFRKPIEVYASFSNSDKILTNSASGGIFSTIATAFLENNGVVYGCSLEYLNDVITPMHIRVDNIKDLYRLQGSKYAKSLISLIYKDIQKDLKDGKNVLFSGTPCQVSALYNFLKVSKVKTDNLFTIDIICHGTPSTKFFTDYIKFYEKKLNGKILDFKFRDKSDGWGLSGNVTYQTKTDKIKNKKVYTNLSSYYKLFLRSETYRENCYNCKYAGELRVSDLTIGDYWGIEEMHPSYLIENGGNIDVKKGISCILVNSSNGKKLIKKYGSNLSLNESTFSNVAYKNKQLNVPSDLPNTRNEILEIYKNYGYSGVDKYYNKRLGLKKILYYVYYLLKK